MIIKYTGLVLVGVIIGYFIFGGKKDYNQTLIDGNTGYPKNCRAIIAQNIKEYKNKIHQSDWCIFFCVVRFFVRKR